MAFPYLRARSGSLSGGIGNAPDRLRKPFRPSGTVAGFYRPRMNATYTVNGAFVRAGNLLPMPRSQTCP